MVSVRSAPGRRVDLERERAQQERQEARLWSKLQRQLTHQRAPWATPEAESSAAVWKLDGWETPLQRMRLRPPSGFGGMRAVASTS